MRRINWNAAGRLTAQAAVATAVTCLCIWLIIQLSSWWLPKADQIYRTIGTGPAKLGMMIILGVYFTTMGIAVCLTVKTALKVLKLKSPRRLKTQAKTGQAGETP